jgi:E3 ubiquitin-protein ligase MARCH6
MDTNDLSELECRVCRCGPEDDRPLYHPCLCSGSIGLVHQNCLETWLTHSNKDKCELCSTKYIFVPEYASDTPSIVPLPLVIKSAIKLFVLKVLPTALKFVMAIVLWLLFVPLWTSWVYRIYFREQTYKDVIIARSSFQTLRGDIISGLVIIGVILLSSIILVSSFRIV